MRVSPPPLSTLFKRVVMVSKLTRGVESLLHIRDGNFSLIGIQANVNILIAWVHGTGNVPGGIAVVHLNG
jgi:hypothetical protein